MEWHTEDAEHSIVNAKVAELVDDSSGFVPGAKVQCKLMEGSFKATILAAGVCVCVYVCVCVRKRYRDTIWHL